MEEKEGEEERAVDGEGVAIAHIIQSLVEIGGLGHQYDVHD